MPVSERTNKDRIYVDILNKEGPLSTKQLAKEAKKHPPFQSMELVAIEKDTLRFAQHYEAMETLPRNGGKLYWLPTMASAPGGQPKSEISLILNKEGFLTSKAAVKCEHCGLTIDLTKAQIKWRLKSGIIQRALHVHHFIRVPCPNCGWTGRYDTGRDVKSLLPEPPSNP
jgi:ribosomal protein S27E